MALSRACKVVFAGFAPAKKCFGDLPEVLPQQMGRALWPCRWPGQPRSWLSSVAYDREIRLAAAPGPLHVGLDSGPQAGDVPFLVEGYMRGQGVVCSDPKLLGGAGSAPSERLSKAFRAAWRAFLRPRIGYRPLSVAYESGVPSWYRTAHDFAPLGCTIRIQTRHQSIRPSRSGRSRASPAPRHAQSAFYHHSLHAVGVTPG